MAPSSDAARQWEGVRGAGRGSGRRIGSRKGHREGGEGKGEGYTTPDWPPTLSAKVSSLEIGVSKIPPRHWNIRDSLEVEAGVAVVGIGGRGCIERWGGGGRCG